MSRQQTGQPQQERQQEKKVISMHEGVEVWQDCCCCEAEPYWIEAMEQSDAGKDEQFPGE